MINPQNDILAELELFKKRFSIFIVTQLDPNNTGNWESKFREALYDPCNDKDKIKQQNWINLFDKNKNNEVIDLIDFHHFERFANNKKKLLEPIFDKRIYQLPTWLHDIAEVRHKLVHFNPNIKTEDVKVALANIELIAVIINDNDLQNGLKAIKDKKNHKNNDITENQNNSKKNDRSVFPKDANYSDGNEGVQETSQTVRNLNKEKIVDSKNWKNIALIVIFVLILGSIFILLLNKDKTDVLKTVNSNNNTTTNNSINSNNNNVNTTLNNITNNLKASNSDKNTQPLQVVMNEDYSNDLNKSNTNTNEYIDVSVTIINSNKDLEQSVSSAIADIYRNTGKKVNNDLIRSDFIRKSAFEKLFEGNTNLIQKLNLFNYTDYLVLGKLNYTFKQGKLVNNTIICNATLDISIISLPYMLKSSFKVQGKGNGTSESQAQDYALNDLFTNYSQDYSTLKN